MALGDLPRRLGVALVGIPTVLGLLYLGGWYLAVPLAGLAALGAAESYDLAERSKIRPLRALGMLAAAGLVLGAATPHGWDGFGSRALVIVAVLVPVSVAVAIWARGVDGGPLGTVSVTLFGAAYAGLALAFVPLLHGLPLLYGWGGPSPSPWAGAFAVVLPLAATWIGDSAAYFAGSAFGRAKILPAVSPKKSWVGLWAGLVGGALAAVLWGLLAASFHPEGPFASPGAAGLALLAAAGALLGLAAFLGDVAESLLKREAGVKDSGTLFPGHGGVLDRLDALTFTLPLAFAMLVAAERLLP